MRRDNVDFFLVEDDQIPMHIRLENWARYVNNGKRTWPTAAIWKMGKSNGRQWYVPELSPTVDPLDGNALEIGVRALPEPMREALRWFYVYRTGPSIARRALGVTNAGLIRLVRDGRTMLRNRRI